MSEFQDKNKTPFAERTLFVVFGDSSFGHLGRWLKTKEFNAVVTGLKDKKGDDMIGLSWDNDDGNKLEKRGVVIVKVPNLLSQTENIVREHLKN